MKTILVIEDDQANRENIVKILELNGFRAIAANNGQQGLQQAHASQPDLILCDIAMPGLDGYGVVAALHQSPTTATIPVVFLTARVDRDEIKYAWSLGIQDYVTKPFTMAQLLAAVHRRLATLPATVPAGKTPTETSR